MSTDRPPRQWSSADHQADTPEFRRFVEREFPAVTDLCTGPDRRQFMRLMAASLAMAGLAGCDDESDGRAQEVPYVRNPLRIQPGAPVDYATMSVQDGLANGIVVTTRNARPLKVEGNPDHPWSRGGTDVAAQASVLDLYDPLRSQTVRYLAKASSWQAFRGRILGKWSDLHQQGGEGLHILTGPLTSPSFLAQFQAMLEMMPKAKWYTHSATGGRHRYAGSISAFGTPLETRYRFDAARVIVSLDGDFLDGGPDQIGAAHDWVAARRTTAANGPLLALYAAASIPTLTAAKADHPLVATPAEMLAIATGLLDATPDADPSPLGQWRAAAAAALLRHRGAGLVVAGASASPALADAVHRLNAALGNTGKTVFHTAPVVATGLPVAALTDAMRRGAVDTLMMLDVNPVYDAPGSLGFADALQQVKLRIHAGLYVDETALRCEWHLPLQQTLESWSDARAADGTITLAQPTISPLYEGRSPSEILSLLMDEAPRVARDMLRSHYQGNTDDAAFTPRWEAMLRDGVVPGTALPPVDAILTPSAPAPVAVDGLAVVIRPDSTLHGGASANNAWLQELPKTLTKLVWDNVLTLSPALAAREGFKTGDIASVTVAGRRVEGPIWVLPGQADQTIGATLGYGRQVPGLLCDGIGYNASALRDEGDPWVLSGAVLGRTGRTTTLATTQDHDTMEGHDFVRVQHEGAPPVGETASWHLPSLYPERRPLEGTPQWGMVIDLDACIGCSACVVACQSENNIAVVGKEQVALGREMHWLRVDRYYEGPAEAPQTRFQPVPCMHCENAPCEVGCPVEATLHDSEGLNLMVYNRCVGTRACSGYCPYKVRHFNYLDYSAGAAPTIELMRNPDVTVRARGVMEKCTYCVQRIENARIDAHKANTSIPEGAVRTACQSACPTRAISFGNLADPASAVAHARADDRNYALLGELNTKPRTSYLAARAAAGPGGCGMSELVDPRQTWASAGQLITTVTLEHRARWRWWIAFGIALGLVGVLVVSVFWLLYEGVGVWGNNVPVTWALDIVGYDWWIGVATGSFAVSALLLLLGAEWRGAVNRLAETVALLGVCAAGLYPIIHLGRPWLFYWNLPYPNTFLLWPQFRSPLFWDAIDIVSFLGVAFLFWFTGLIPDLAAMRDRSIEAMNQGADQPGRLYRRLRAQLYGIPALGWRGSVIHWQRWEHSYRALAILGLVVVLSLQTGAAVMFAGTVEPGWHDPMLPIAYIVGALLSGVAVTGTLLAVVRFVLPYEPLITPRHIDLLAWLMLALSILFLYCDACSFGVTALVGSAFDHGVMTRRLHGPHAWATWASILCSVLPPQLFWIPAFRRSSAILGGVGILVAFGSWADHFMLIVITLQHDFLPSASHPYAIGAVGMATFVGTAGLFLFLFLLALRYVPMLSIVNLRWLLPALPIRKHG